MKEISQKDFVRLTDFVKRNYGIDLTKKEQLITSRLQSTINEPRFGGFEKYVEYITTSAKDSDIDLMLNKLTTNYTYFYREENHFEFFKKVILPYLEQTKKNKSISIWSAGCSSGEEPYTISMILKDYFGKHSAWDTRVLARTFHKTSWPRPRHLFTMMRPSRTCQATGRGNTLLKTATN